MSSARVFRLLPLNPPGGVGGGEFSSPASLNGSVDFGVVGADLRAFTSMKGKLRTPPGSGSANTFGYPGASPSVSSDAAADGIVWAIKNAGGRRLCA